MKKGKCIRCRIAVFTENVQRNADVVLSCDGPCGGLNIEILATSEVEDSFICLVCTWMEANSIHNRKGASFVLENVNKKYSGKIF
jgi:hypothetical protein